MKTPVVCHRSPVLHLRSPVFRLPSPVSPPVSRHRSSVFIPQSPVSRPTSSFFSCKLRYHITRELLRWHNKQNGNCGRAFEVLPTAQMVVAHTNDISLIDFRTTYCVCTELSHRSVYLYPVLTEKICSLL